MAVARRGFCTSLLYEMTAVSKNTVKAVLTTTRSGYLAKQYHDLLALLFALEHTADGQLEAQPENALKNVLKERSHIEAAVSLFAKPKVAKEVRTLYVDIVQAGTVLPQFDERIEKLARAFRGPRLSKLSPQRRWFR